MAEAILSVMWSLAKGIWLANALIAGVMFGPMFLKLYRKL
jgi:hypothetical protein